jgi:hypothetical protein
VKHKHYSKEYSADTLVAICRGYMSVASQPEPRPRHVARVVFGLLPPEARAAVKSVKEMQRILHGLTGSSNRIAAGRGVRGVPHEVMQFLPLPVLHPAMSRSGPRRMVQLPKQPATPSSSCEMMVVDRGSRSEITVTCAASEKHLYIQAISKAMSGKGV